MNKKIFTYSVCVLLLFSLLAGRIGYIIFSGAYLVSDSYNSYTLTIDTKLPNLFYDDGTLLTNNVENYVAVIRPQAQAIAEMTKLFDTAERNEINEDLKKGYPVLKAIDKEKINRANHITVYKTTASDYSCTQFINRQSSGLLSYLPLSIGTKKINFTIDAKGRLLKGDNGTVMEENYESQEGYILSINKAIQDIAQKSSKNMKSGCVLVMNVKDASIAACVIKPNESYINKALSQYAVGSIFKIVVLACAIENDLNPFYNCRGSISIGDTVFSCQSKHVHGYQNLKEALGNSCNCYFVNLAMKLGSEKLLDTMKRFGFEKETELFDKWTVKNASVPTKNDLQSKGELALLGFGQGKLTATPLQMCSALCVIGNGGFYNSPKLVMQKVSNNAVMQNIEYDSPVRVIDKKNTQTILRYLRYVVTNGTGRNAETSSHSSLGKTATAQTGQYSDGRELLNTWFAGLYPYSNPRYAIVVMTEDGISGSGDCCPIYRSIVEKLDIL